MAISHIPLGSKLLVSYNLDTNANCPKGDDQDEDGIADILAAVLKDMQVHFLPLHTKTWVRYGQKWSMIRLVHEVQSSMGYLMGTDHCLFQKLSDQ